MRLYASAKLGISNTLSRGARFLKNFGAPLATKFTYKMRSGGKGMWGRGPALYKHNYYFYMIEGPMFMSDFLAYLSVR